MKAQNQTRFEMLVEQGIDLFKKSRPDTALIGVDGSCVEHYMRDMRSLDEINAVSLFFIDDFDDPKYSYWFHYHEERGWHEPVEVPPMIWYNKIEWPMPFGFEEAYDKLEGNSRSIQYANLWHYDFFKNPLYGFKVIFDKDAGKDFEGYTFNVDVQTSVLRLVKYEDFTEPRNQEHAIDMDSIKDLDARVARHFMLS